MSDLEPKNVPVRAGEMQATRRTGTDNLGSTAFQDTQDSENEIPVPKGRGSPVCSEVLRDDVEAGRYV